MNINKLISYFIIAWSTVLVSQEITLLGFICADNTGIAIFESDENSDVLRVGQKFKGFTLLKVVHNGVYIEDSGAISFVKPGFGNYHLSPVTVRQGFDGLSVYDDQVEISADLRDYIAGPGLLKILWQAAVTQESDEFGPIGFSIWDIDPGSIYDAAGLQSGDLVLDIDGTGLTDAVTAIKALNRVKSLDSFTFTFRRGGHDYIRTINIK